MGIRFGEFKRTNRLLFWERKTGVTSISCCRTKPLELNHVKNCSKRRDGTAGRSGDRLLSRSYGSLPSSCIRGGVLRIDASGNGATAAFPLAHPSRVAYMNCLHGPRRSVNQLMHNSYHCDLQQTIGRGQTSITCCPSLPFPYHWVPTPPGHMHRRRGFSCLICSFRASY